MINNLLLSPFRARGLFFSVTLLLVAATFFPLSGQVQAQPVRTQALDLKEGWNAVFLEVAPIEADPAVIFADVPVDVVASFMPSSRGAQFVSNPSADKLRAYGWRVWYAPHRGDAFLSRLSALSGGTPYLIHSAEAASLSITGHAVASRVRWTPNAYNFVGFTVAASGGPTFRQFFEASKAHNHNKIYRMKNGLWRQVLDPSAEVMRSGEAFWIYTKGRSDYAGPLDVQFRSPFGLVLTPDSGQSLVLRNRTAHPVLVTLEHVVGENDEIPLALSVQTRDTGEARSLRTMQFPLETGAWSYPLPLFESGEGLRLSFAVLRDHVAGTRHALLRVRTDLGTETYVPLTTYSDAITATLIQ